MKRLTLLTLLCVTIFGCGDTFNYETTEHVGGLCPPCADSGPDASEDVGVDTGMDTGPDAPSVDVGSPDTGEPDTGHSCPDTGQEPDVGEPDTGPNPTDSLAFLQRHDTRAVYAWIGSNHKLELFLSDSGNWRTNWIKFLKAPHGRADKAMNRVYLQGWQPDSSGDVDTVVVDGLQDARMAEAVTQLHSAGIEVEFLLSSGPQAPSSDANVAKLTALAKRVTDYNRSVAQAARFDGVSWNIEPWAAAGWRQGATQHTHGNSWNPDWERRLFETFDQTKARLDAYEADTGHRMAQSYFIGVDHAWWSYTLGEYFNSTDSLDYLVAGNYLDATPNRQGDNSFVYGAAHDWYTSTAPGWPDQTFFVDGLLQVGPEMAHTYWHSIPFVLVAETINWFTSSPGSEVTFWCCGAGSDSTYDGYNNLFDSLDLLESVYLYGNAIGWGVHYGGWPGDGSFYDMQAGD